MQASDLTLPERRARAAQMIAFAFIKNKALPDYYIATACGLKEKDIPELKRIIKGE